MSKKVLDLFCFTIRDEHTDKPYVAWAELKDVMKSVIGQHYYISLLQFLSKKGYELRREGLCTDKLKEFLSQKN